MHLKQELSTVRQSRKLDHLTFSRELGDGPGYGCFSDLTLIHNCLPELSWQEIRLDTSIAGIPLRHPVIINAITGGAADVTDVNHRLAELAKLTGAAMAVGSQYAALENREVWASYEIVRRVHEDGVLMANLGAHATVAQARIAVEMIGANALQIHLNAAQELFMTEGDRDFRGYLDNISAIATKIGVPVIVKEVGCGIAREAALQLAAAGIHCIDVGGRGGTNFVAIEAARAQQSLPGEMAAWGIPTAVSALETASVLPPHMDMIVSGGIRTPLDAVKALVSGGRAVAMAGSFIRLLHDRDVPAGAAWLEAFLLDMRRLMLLAGAASIDDLYRVPFIVSGYAREWLTARNIDTKQYANR